MPGASTTNGAILAMLKGNVSGQIQQVPPVTINGARERAIVETITLAAQAAGARIAVARVPIGAAVLGITLIADAVTAATIALGNYNSDTRYSAAVALAAANAAQVYAAAASYGVPIVTGYDSDTGATNKGYDDIILVTAGAALPGAGTMKVRTVFVLD